MTTELKKQGQSAVKIGVKLLFQSALNYFYKYSKEELEALRKVADAYTRFCYEKEKDHTSSTLYNIEDNGKITQSKLPKYFTLENEIPIIFSENVHPNVDDLSWKRDIADNTKLRNEAEEIISWICLYLDQRNNRSRGKMTGFLSKGTEADKMARFSDWRIENALRKIFNIQLPEQSQETSQDISSAYNNDDVKKTLLEKNDTEGKKNIHQRKKERATENDETQRHLSMKDFKKNN